MSLRVRLFLLLGCLVFLLVSAQGWLVRALTRDLSSELGQVVMYVGHHLVTSLPDVEVLEQGVRTMALDVRIHDEEQFMRVEFGMEWEIYAAETWMLIPYVY